MHELTASGRKVVTMTPGSPKAHDKSTVLYDVFDFYNEVVLFLVTIWLQYDLTIKFTRSDYH